jgi:transcriptional regulator with XRE-family HTH domain
VTTTRDFATLLRAKLASDNDLHCAVDKARFSADVAQQIYDARVGAKLTQTQLADLAGMHQSVIARLEDADYTGHSLNTLWKIAWALNSRLSVSFEPRTGEEPSDPSASFVLADAWVVDCKDWNPTVKMESIADGARQGVA